ncbi:tagatose-6-phosphate kinase [Enterococcus cecorum]|uniref:Tagatose-6-phosphate kinase n=1 Tax=Enterococcus cecorum TaxID=44008 RepID=A0A200HZD4_9ENTE|nr:tagatose-6-phosphate kinase [Enterococcus cecorum]MCJ0581442.1 tagatose-6-phosphate kinase [Enterococcus cecorum]MCJ0593566.1 tagatose-6-phosphate kinase [Enterococcus cecorum]MDZ5577453.1 tagatose-6-phosphate kinase [Enterococcus cecorum]OUZ18088.1 tagatose-6-phosphate kinase [Enterococcus cecorum]CAI3275067.1 tagatose-6-phosphate kinase [Enterococcus cecorum]
MIKIKPILTVTMNPSVDIVYQLDSLELDTTNRVNYVYKTAGGKGLNVSRVLHQLCVPVLATGMVGGVLGEFITRQLDEICMPHNFLSISSPTRNCIAILHDGKQTEILEPGPTLTKAEYTNFIQHFSNLLLETQIVCISGSLAKGVPNTYYIDLIKLCRQNNIPCLLDCSNEALLNVLNSSVKPTLIKPNLMELSRVVQQSFTDNLERELVHVLNQPLFSGIEWIIVSLGSDGAIAKHNDIFYRVEIPSIDVINPVGSGDATIAGLACGLAKQLTDEEILIFGNVCGMLNAQENETGKINIKNLPNLREQIRVIKIN